MAKVNAENGYVGVNIVPNQDALIVSVNDGEDCALVRMTYRQAERLAKALESQMDAIGKRNFRKLVRDAK